MKDIPVWYICIQDLMKLCFEYLSIGKNYDVSYRVLREVLLTENALQVKKYSKEVELHHYQCEL